MKNIIMIVLLLAFSISSFGQQIKPSPGINKQDYLQKSKKQKKTAVILLGGGAALLLTGLIIPKGDYKGTYNAYAIIPVEEYKNDGIKAALGLTGIASMLASIPFFIASGKNKRKSEKVAVFIDMKKTHAIQLVKNQGGSFTAIGLKLIL